MLEYGLLKCFYLFSWVVEWFYQYARRLGLFLLVQLRNLLWATSKHDVYLVQNFSVMHWNSLLRRGTEVLNVAKPIVPTEVFKHSTDQLAYVDEIQA